MSVHQCAACASRTQERCVLHHTKCLLISVALLLGLSLPPDFSIYEYNADFLRRFSTKKKDSIYRPRQCDSTYAASSQWILLGFCSVCVNSVISDVLQKNFSYTFKYFFCLLICIYPFVVLVYIYQQMLYSKGCWFVS